MEGESVDDDFGMWGDPSRPRFTVLGNVGTTVATAESVDECGVRSRIVESRGVEGDTVGVTEMSDLGFADDHHGDAERVVVISVETSPAPRDAVADAGRLVVKLIAAARTVRGCIGA